MNTTKRLCARALMLGLMLLIACNAVPAKDKGFDSIVRHIETHYRARRTRIPFLGLAGFAVKIIRPAGVKSLKLAVFEDQDFSDAVGDTKFEEVMRGALEQQWQPLVRVNSRRGGERVYIFSKANKDDVELMIVTLEQHEAVALQVRINPDRLMKFINDHDEVRGGLWKGKGRRNEECGQNPGVAQSGPPGSGSAGATKASAGTGIGSCAK
ncbi:MAG TPA: hypothetical protein VFD58_25835 [Blastocatellia bacterium]|nr:hypothetical protein [Blastocatellia bacterium]